MELVLIIVAAGGLLGCFGAVARLDMSKPRYGSGRPIQRCVVR